MTDLPLSTDRDLLRFVARNPRRFFGVDEPSLEEMIAFLVGLDAGRGFSLLSWFATWLIVRLRSGYELHWTGLAECAAYGVDPPLSNARGKSVAENRAAAGRLFKIVDEFLADVWDRDRVVEVSAQYRRLRERDGLT